MSFRKAYRRYRTLWVSLIACGAFLALAVWGWGVEPGELAGFLGAAAVLLLGLILLAALVGYVLFKLRRWREK
ncbi:hypothetical protein [Marinimicrobium locisalis]|uniref:hypothetical protein n=1 Tax=Marinimicrobium locisalis TaxID=546022 RepID=UPI0032218E76